MIALAKLHFPSEDYRKTLIWAFYILMPVIIFVASFVYVLPALAHGGAYCGHTARWVWPYKQTFISHYDNGDHYWKSREYMHSGTGYVAVPGTLHYHRADCHPH